MRVIYPTYAGLQHAFSVVRSAGSSTYNFVNPVQRDVVSTGSPGDNVTIRFKTDNPGPWILHWFVLCSQLLTCKVRLCPFFYSHIDWHLDM